MNCVKDRWVFKVLASHGVQIDTTSPSGRLVFDLFAVLVEFERELIVEQTNAELVAARARGRIGERSRKVDVTILKMVIVANQLHQKWQRNST